MSIPCKQHATALRIVLKHYNASSSGADPSQLTCTALQGRSTALQQHLIDRQCGYSMDRSIDQASQVWRNLMHNRQNELLMQKQVTMPHLQQCNVQQTNAEFDKLQSQHCMHSHKNHDVCKTYLGSLPH